MEDHIHSFMSMVQGTKAAAGTAAGTAMIGLGTALAIIPGVAGAVASILGAVLAFFLIRKARTERRLALMKIEDRKSRRKDDDKKEG